MADNCDGMPRRLCLARIALQNAEDDVIVYDANPTWHAYAVMRGDHLGLHVSVRGSCEEMLIRSMRIIGADNLPRPKYVR